MNRCSMMEEIQLVRVLIEMINVLPSENNDESVDLLKCLKADQIQKDFLYLSVYQYFCTTLHLVHKVQQSVYARAMIIIYILVMFYYNFRLPARATSIQYILI